MSTPTAARARLAANIKHHPDRDHTEDRRALASAKLEAYAARVVADAPPLTSAQIDRIVTVLRGSPSPRAVRRPLEVNERIAAGGDE